MASGIKRLFASTHKALYPIPRDLDQTGLIAARVKSIHERFTAARKGPSYNAGPRVNAGPVAGTKIAAQVSPNAGTFEPTRNSKFI